MCYGAAVSVEQIIGLIVALLIMSVGIVGSLLPALPSTPLILLIAIAHKLYFGAAGVGWLMMTLLAVSAVAAAVLFGPLTPTPP